MTAPFHDSDACVTYAYEGIMSDRCVRLQVKAEPEQRKMYVLSVLLGPSVGVVGLACARALAKSGREVIVLESGKTIGSETSSRHSEGVAVTDACPSLSCIKACISSINTAPFQPPLSGDVMF